MPASSDKQRDLKLALQLQCAWPPSTRLSELVTGWCVLASTHQPVTSSLGQAPGGCSVSWLLSYAKYNSHTRDQCVLTYFATRQLSRSPTVQYRRMRRNRSQKFVVLWLKITFHITLSQLKYINLHKPWPITVHKSTNTVCYYTWQAHALESIHT